MTTPKVKDLVNIHTEKYNAIYDVIHQSSKQNLKKEPPDSQNSETIDIRSLLLPVKEIEEPSNMKNELKSFLKKQMQGSPPTLNSNKIDDFHSSSTSIDFLDSMPANF